MRADSIRQFVKYAVLGVAGTGGLLMSFCSSPASVEGGGTRGGNPVVTGKIVGKNGVAQRNVQVALITEGYNPVADAGSAILPADTTDSLGEYSIETADSGRYTVEAVGIMNGERAIRFAVDAIPDSTVVLPADTLQKPGVINLVIPAGSASSGGYAYVPGTSIGVEFSDSRDTVRIDSVPSGVLPELILSQESTAAEVVGTFVSVVAGETTLVVDGNWNNSRRVYLNTTASGADVEGDVYNFPVLIRLSSDNFNFSEIKPDGSDLLFTGSGNVRLSHEIERWDPDAGHAEVWVRVDTVFGNDAQQSIMMFWGNSGEVSLPEENSVFDTTAGYQGVWHLGDGAEVPVRDATVNNYNGTSPDTAQPQVAEGVIGSCRQFNGSNNFITMAGTASGKLDFSEKGSYTVSAWVRLDTFDNVSHCIVSKGYEQYYLRSTYISTSLPSGTPLWEFVEFSDADKWQASNTPATQQEWTLLTGVRDGERQLLYCNGVPVDSTMDTWTNTVSRNTSNDLTIGRFASPVLVPIIEGYCYFKGGIDEVRIISAAQNADWVRLCYMNQRPDDRLVEFR